jgi:hypothetical protein
MKKSFLFFVVVFSTTLSFAQSSEIKRTNHWYFGENCGIDFSSGVAVPDTNGQINTLEGCAAISDTSGNLLFYTDGIYVWDSTHTQMANGFGLHGDNSSLNCTVIVPKPGDNNIFYIFTTPAYAGHWSGNTAFEYSIVDMTLNGGLGDVLTKNISLFSTAIEQLGAVHHQNGIDYWVVAHEAFSNNFRAYLVTSAGVSNTPVISSIGLTNGGYSTACWGCAASGLKFSPSGCKLACTYPSNDTLQIFDFDNSSGIILNPITINITYPWNSCFSPDNNFLYLGCFNYNISQDKIYQFDLSSNTSSGISSSKITLSSNIIGSQATMQNAPDGKIYCSKYNDSSLAVINYPNNAGTSCGFVINGLYLGGKICQAGITNFVQSYFVNDTVQYECLNADINEFSPEANIHIYPNPFSTSTTFSSNYFLKNATINIYNSLGILILRLDNISGDSFAITNENLPSGIYYFQLEAEHSKISSGKLIVVD